MINSVQSRIYRALTELIPSMSPTESRTYFSPPRLDGDIAIHCSVDVAADGDLLLEIAHDERVEGDKAPKAWICFRVDPARRAAHVTRFQEGWNYTVATQRVDADSSRVNLYAANWLTVFTTMRRMFQPIELAVPA